MTAFFHFFLFFGGLTSFIVILSSFTVGFMVTGGNQWNPQILAHVLELFKLHLQPFQYAKHGRYQVSACLACVAAV